MLDKRDSVKNKRGDNVIYMGLDKQKQKLTCDDLRKKIREVDKSIKLRGLKKKQLIEIYNDVTGSNYIE